jgi:hypothetical protein
MLEQALSANEYGVRRAAIRLITKLEHPERGEYLVRTSLETRQDEGSRCVLAWGLGGVINNDAAHALSRLYSPTSLLSTRRVVLIGATRQRNEDLLKRLAVDPDAELSAQAAATLERIRADEQDKITGSVA